MLDPATTDWMELALVNLGLDSFIGGGVVLFQPLVLLSLGAGKVGLGVALHEIALVGPGPDDLALRLSPGPQPTAVDVAVANAEHNGVLSHFVDAVGIHIRTQDLLGNLATLDDGLLVVDLEGIDDLHGNGEGVVLLSRVLWKLSCGIANLPHIEEKHASREVDGNDVGLGEGEVPVRVWRRNTSLTVGRISEHAVACHFNINRVLLAIAEGLGDNPLDALAATGEALNGNAVMGPDGTFIVGIPVELDALLIIKVTGDAQDCLEPVSRPRGTERGADVGFSELVGSGLLEGRAGGFWGIPDP